MLGRKEPRSSPGVRLVPPPCVYGDVAGCCPQICCSRGGLVPRGQARRWVSLLAAGRTWLPPSPPSAALPPPPPLSGLSAFEPREFFIIRRAELQRRAGINNGRRSGTGHRWRCGGMGTSGERRKELCIPPLPPEPTHSTRTASFPDGFLTIHHLGPSFPSFLPLLARSPPSNPPPPVGQRARALKMRAQKVMEPVAFQHQPSLGPELGGFFPIAAKLFVV